MAFESSQFMILSALIAPSNSSYANTFDAVEFMYHQAISLKLYTALLNGKKVFIIGLKRISRNANQISKKAQLPQFGSLSTGTLDHLQRPLFLHHSAKNQYLFTNNLRNCQRNENSNSSNNQRNSKRRFKNKAYKRRRNLNRDTLLNPPNVDIAKKNSTAKMHYFGT
jgi:hypothetical protein